MLLASLPATASLLPVFAVMEGSRVFAAVGASGGWDLLGGVLVLSVAAAAYMLCHVVLIQVELSISYCCVLC